MIIVLSTDQQRAIDDARTRMDIDIQEFGVRALAMLCAAAGVELPASVFAPAGVSLVEPTPARPSGGRQRAPVTWAMDNDVPAGSFGYVCPNCGRAFRQDTDRARYCSQRCKVAVQNMRAYRNRAKV